MGLNQHIWEKTYPMAIFIYSHKADEDGREQPVQYSNTTVLNTPQNSHTKNAIIQVLYDSIFSHQAIINQLTVHIWKKRKGKTPHQNPLSK